MLADNSETWPAHPGNLIQSALSLPERLAEGALRHRWSDDTKEMVNSWPTPPQSRRGARGGETCDGIGPRIPSSCQAES